MFWYPEFLMGITYDKILLLDETKPDNNIFKINDYFIKIIIAYYHTQFQL